MNDLILETCNYIYKNPKKSKNRYIKDMSERSIWRGSCVKSIIEDYLHIGILKEVEIYNSTYESSYMTLEVDIEGYIKQYSPSFSDDISIFILEYIIKNPRRSENTYKNSLTNMKSEFSEEEIIKTLRILLGKSILRYRMEIFNDDIKYQSLYVDFYSLKIDI